MANSNVTNGDDAGKLVLRLALGLMLLLHGIAKVTGGIGGISGMLERAGMPAVLGYAVFLGEVVAPLLIIVGAWTRLAALLVIGNMIVAVLLVHRAEIFTLAKTGGWALELQGFYFFTAIALLLMGAGRYSLGGPHGRWN
jgi:putative oxidoreductase